MSRSAVAKDDRIGALPPARRRAVHVIGALVWVTGAVWLIFKYFVRVPDEFGFDNPHPLMGSWMIAHAFASLGAVWLFGVLWRGHVVRGDSIFEFLLFSCVYHEEFTFSSDQQFLAIGRDAKAIGAFDDRFGFLFFRRLFRRQVK